MDPTFMQRFAQALMARQKPVQRFSGGGLFGDGPDFSVPSVPAPSMPSTPPNMTMATGGDKPWYQIPTDQTGGVVGGAVGSVAGGMAGGYFGGPAGAVGGGIAGGLAGHAGGQYVQDHVWEPVFGHSAGVLVNEIKSGSGRGNDGGGWGWGNGGNYGIGGGPSGGGGGGGIPGIPGIPDPTKALPANPFGTGFSATAPALNTALPSGVGMDTGDANATRQQQQQLYKNLLDQASGVAKSPGDMLAQHMLQQATAQNNTTGAGLISSQRGINPALAARLVGQQTAANNQQAAAAGANLDLNQRLGAQNALSGMLQGMRGQDITSAADAGNIALGDQGHKVQGIADLNNATNAGSIGTQDINGKQAIAGLGARTGALGGLLNAAGALGGAAIIAGGMPGSQPTPADPEAGGYDTTNGATDMGDGAGAGGMTTGATPPPMWEARGGGIPGQAPFPGDDPRNDQVNAKLAAGEIVIPRSISMHPMAPELAAEFVRQVRAGRGPAPRYEGDGAHAACGGEVGRYADGGGVEGDGPKAKRFVDALRGKAAPSQSTAQHVRRIQTIRKQLAAIESQLSSGGGA